MLSIRARKCAIDGDIARTRSFSVADNDFNDTSSTVPLCLTTLVKVTAGILNDQFASRQRRYIHRYDTAHSTCQLVALKIPKLQNAVFCALCAKCYVCEQKIRLILWFDCQQALYSALRNSLFRSAQSHLYQIVLLTTLVLEHIMEYCTHTAKIRESNITWGNIIGIFSEKIF